MSHTGEIIMAGKYYTGGTTNNAGEIRSARAYCEGRQAAADGILNSANPHPNPSEAFASWGFGHLSWTIDPATDPNKGQDNCAAEFGGGFV